MHSNGFSLVRKIVADNGLDLNSKYEETGDKTLGEMLLTPTRIYVKQVHDVLKEIDVHGIAHITGGGFDENIPQNPFRMPRDRSGGGKLGNPPCLQHP